MTTYATIAEIQQVVAEEFFLRVPDLLSDRRDVEVVNARHVAMLLAREEAGYSWTTIGQKCGARDHTTVCAGARSIKEKLKRDANLRDIFERCRRRLAETEIEPSAKQAIAATRSLFSVLEARLIACARRDPAGMLRRLSEIAEMEVTDEQIKA